MMSTVNILQCRHVLSKVFLCPRIADSVGGQARQIPGNTAYHRFGPPAEKKYLLLFSLGTVSKIICVIFVENSTKGGGRGGSAVLQVLVRIFGKMLKVLQMLQFIQK